MHSELAACRSRSAASAAITIQRADRVDGGAGIKGGQVIGATDEFGYKAMEQPISYHYLHATICTARMDHTTADLPLQRPRHAAHRTSTGR